MVRPTLQALLIADHVYQDRVTGKHVVCGIFGRIITGQSANPGQVILSSNDPRTAGVQSGSPFAYVSLTDVEGTQVFEVRYVKLSDESVIFVARLSITSNDRLQAVQTAIPLPPLPRDLGVYALELVWNSVEPLGSYRVTVVAQSDATDDN